MFPLLEITIARAAIKQHSGAFKTLSESPEFNEWIGHADVLAVLQEEWQKEQMVRQQLIPHETPRDTDVWIQLCVAERQMLCATIDV